MKTKEQVLITVPESPYKILDVPFYADAKMILKAMRALFKKDPRKGGRIGSIAQKKLTDPKERIKVDAFCCEVDVPHVDLSGLKKQLGSDNQELYCHALEHFIVFSDLSFPDEVPHNLDIEIDFGEIPYRSGYDTNRE
jgi:hypothetical protein